MWLPNRPVIFAMERSLHSLWIALSTHGKPAAPVPEFK